LFPSAEPEAATGAATGAAAAALAAAFRATCYRVDAGDGSFFDLRIGVVQPAFAAWLRTLRVTRWAIVSAHNPQSAQACRLSANDNDERDARLGERLRQVGWRHARSVAIADAGDWPAEEGFLVLDAPLAALVALAAEFCQAAIVCGELAAESGGADSGGERSAEALPRLLWLVTGESGREAAAPA
jgi:hypothetical protein